MIQSLPLRTSSSTGRQTGKLKIVVKHLSYMVIYELSSSHSKKVCFTHYQISLQCLHLSGTFIKLVLRSFILLIFSFNSISSMFSKGLCVCIVSVLSQSNNSV